MNHTSNTTVITRREFISLSALTSAAILTGCATNPVTGKKELMFYTEADEIRMDRQASPHQFSADYGPIRDPALNAYLEQVGRDLTHHSHRPNMPYSFRAVNASNVNAYAFLGGSVATTRGILLAMENEAELAALLGHEIGHVNARHSARQMTSNSMLALGLAVASVAAAQEKEEYGAIVSGLGGIGAGMLLARYSRGNEREADELGMRYMVKSGYNPQGMIGLQDILRNMSKGKPNVIELMFATHPMSEERYQTAVQRAAKEFPHGKDLPLQKERYMDQTAKVRALKRTIEAIQQGDQEIARKQVGIGLSHYQRALQQTPDDYEALLKAAKACLALNQAPKAADYASQAKAVYPEEAQAYHVSAMAGLSAKKFDSALANLETYEQKLPGNPNTIFYQGLALDNMGRKTPAIEKYRAFLQMVQQGDEAQHAYQRLVEWGAI